MYATTKFNWFDQSQIEREATVTTAANRPLFLTCITADKGTEETIRIYGDDFYKMYGRDLSFERHGQPLLQAANIINAGGELLVKRLVAEDATLSNVILVANVTEKKVQQTNEAGLPLYIDATSGEPTTEATGKDSEEHNVQNDPLTDSSAVIKWEAKSIENCATFDEVKAEAVKLFNAETGVFPLIVATDIGRNNDCKAIRIIPDYDISRSVGFMFYRVFEYESTRSEESINVTLNPYVKYQNTSYAINPFSMGELKLDMVDDVFDAYVSALADIAGVDPEVMSNYDVINGRNLKGIPIPGIEIDADSVDLSTTYGVTLASGSNGGNIDEAGTATFAEAPIKSIGANGLGKYTEYAIKFFSGGYDEQIYDVDVNKVCAVIDANFPVPVKKTIGEFVNFREDAMFFEDLGLNLTTFGQISEADSELPKSRYVASYMTSYQILDPYSNKRIPVTMTYSLAPILVTHFRNHPANPLAGEVNGFTITDAIKGTVNYIPRKIPGTDQKNLLEEAHINYATYTEAEGPLVVSSLYTSQTEYTQLSYINAVIAVQEIIRTLRTECPKNRFRFTTGNDFTTYSEACEEVLERFKADFASLKFTYLKDPVKESQKIYYAAIEVAFNNWSQAEIFDLYAIPTAIEDIAAEA